MAAKKELLRLKRHQRIRLRINGTLERPRLIVHRSLKNLSAQVVDDTANKTIFFLSTSDRQIKDKFPATGNIKAAQFFGEIFSKKLIEKGITKVVFDRAGYLYHGRIKAFVESLRKGGLEF